MTATWPGSISLKAHDGVWGEEFEDNLTEFAPEKGAPKRRPTYSVQTTIENFRLYLSKAQRDTLRSFYQSDCNYGAVNFTVTHPIDGVSAEFQFVSFRVAYTQGKFIADMQLRRIS